MDKLKERNERVTTLIEDLIKAFPETRESVFVVLIKKLIEYNFSDADISGVVDHTILNVNKNRLTVADVIGNETAGKKYAILDYPAE